MKKTDIKNTKLNSKDEEDDPQEKIECKDQVKIEHTEGPKRWYKEDQESEDDGKKWNYLEHHGATFPEPFLPHGTPVSYNGKEIKLTASEEELAWYWCEAIGTDYEQVEFFRKNFFAQFTVELKKKYPDISDLNSFDFSKILALVQKEREDNRNRTDEEKLKRKMLKEETDRIYGYAIVDNIVQKISGYAIQPPNLLRGRGANPKAGLLKPRIYPEGVVLNLAEDAPIPRCPMPGHAWGSVECKQDTTWLCSYKNNTVSTSSTCKYVALAANSKFKGQNDRKKYEKARRLKRQIDRIRADYTRKIEDTDMKNRQLGTATYLIENLALRVGNEKGEDETDTKGCCTLLVSNLKVLPGDQITLDFLGKDSIQYMNTVKVSAAVWRNIAEFIGKKSPQQPLFDSIDAQALNEYLKSQMEGLTAKVFRTYNASTTLEKELRKVDLQGLSMEAKIEKYNEANRQVAILCNHQKTVSKKLVQNLKKREQEIEMQKQYLAELQKHKNSFTTKKDKIERQSVTVTIEGLKPLTKKFPETKEASVQAVRKLVQRIQKEEKALRQKDEGKQIALGTSKTNYNDPRISVAWCKANEVKIEKILNKNLLSKFIWAMYTDADYEF